MTNKINPASISQEPQTTDFNKRFEEEKAKIQKSPIFQDILPKLKERHLDEMAFLMATFDKDINGEISQEEIESVDLKTMINNLLKHRLTEKEPLELVNFEDTKAELSRNIKEPDGKGFMSTLFTAMQADADINNFDFYVDFLNTFDKLKNKENLTTFEQAKFETAKVYVEMMDKDLSPEATQRVLESAKKK